MGLVPPTSRAPVAEDIYLAALGYQTWNFNPYAISAADSPTSQTVFALAVPVAPGVVYTGVKLIVSTPGAGTTPVAFQVGLASQANMGAQGTVLTQSGNLNGSASLTTNGIQTFPFLAPYTETITGMRMVLILQNGAFGTTPFTIERTGASSVFSQSGPALVATAGLAAAALPANGNSLGVNFAGGTARAYWVALY